MSGSSSAAWADSEAQADGYDGSSSPYSEPWAAEPEQSDREGAKADRSQDDVSSVQAQYPEPRSWRDPRLGHAHHSRLERTLEAIGMGRYQLHLLLLTGSGWAADNAWMTAIPMVLPAVQDSDTYGRLPSFTYTLAITTLFAIVLPFSPSFGFLCFSLFLLGSGLGGSMPTDGTIFLENTPKSKQYLTVALSTFFSAGAALSSAWAIIVMPCRTAAFFLSRIFLFTLYESPRYLVSQGRSAEARRVLQQIVEYNDTTEQEAFESIARSADANSADSDQQIPRRNGLQAALHVARNLLHFGPTRQTSPSQRAERDVASDLSKHNEIDRTPDSDSPGDTESNSDLDSHSRSGSPSLRPKHLDRGMSVRLSDVRSWSAASGMRRASRANDAGRHESIPPEWRSSQSDAEQARGRTSPTTDQTSDGRSLSRHASASPLKHEQRQDEREGLLTGRLSADHTRSYQDDSVSPEQYDADAASIHRPVSARSISDKTGSLHDRVKILVSAPWRRTTVLTWAIWTTLNLGYTMLNVFLPKILEERAGGRSSTDVTPPNTQSQSSDADALWSYFAYALASIPAPLVAAYLAETRYLRRKGTLALSLGCTSALMMLLSSALSSAPASQATPPSGDAAQSGGTTLILVLISFSATTAYAALYGYTPELFAIELRGTACGVASAAGRLAGVMAPMIGGWLLGRTGDAEGHGGRGSGAGGLCGLSASMLALTAVFTLALPRDTDGGPEREPLQDPESVA
ncbi:hypothetical protein OC845_002327 [Tilletia horrida]|nr:hypothetical protein OC845_002327 [Tilletia horrida]